MAAFGAVTTGTVAVTPKSPRERDMQRRLTHFDDRGAAHMVDVAAKAQTHRVARASGSIRMRPATLRMILAGTSKKGDVLGVARIAAIQGAKRASEIIPLCHPLALTRGAAEFESSRRRSKIGRAACRG